MPKRNLRKDVLRSASLRTFVEFAVEVFANDMNAEMNEEEIDHLILNEIQIKFYINPMWLRPRERPKNEIDIFQKLKEKGIKFWGMSRGYYVFYRGERPMLSKKWRKQIYNGIIRIRPHFIEQGEWTGGDPAPKYQTHPQKLRREYVTDRRVQYEKQ